MELEEFRSIPARPRELGVQNLLKWRAFSKAKDPNQVHRYIDCYDDKDEEVPHPSTRGNPIQREGERRFAGRGCYDPEGGDENRVEVDDPQVLIADGVDMATEAQRDDVGIDRDGDRQCPLVRSPMSLQAQHA